MEGVCESEGSDEHMYTGAGTSMLSKSLQEPEQLLCQAQTLLNQAAICLSEMALLLTMLQKRPALG